MVDPGFETLEMVLETIRDTGDRAAIVDLYGLAMRRAASQRWKLKRTAPSRPERPEAINSVKHFEGLFPAYKIAIPLTGAKKFTVLKVNSYLVSFLFVSSKFQLLKI